ncbi:hypothetical protein PtA15_13A245 [Puccinia triticina]|uniref:tRNA ligase n=1 Tax=Puccinia triticina TaxID=208348 RepID=A0ABY7CZU3_9BASI|nr:uncharacterized protein PtA15_13A245 [Puccinia triticina]WAQ90846.1 hypothetical protein PtA15_13A245 [Puccinia triticina]WAR61035.1 hypothetical protein PtB15_13B286 [Puccinia triticina]
MTAASPLARFEPQPTTARQTDLLIHSLLHFGQPHGPPTTPATTAPIVELDEQAIAEALANIALAPATAPADPKLAKLIRSRLYELTPALSVRSWTMAEHVYRKLPCPFPTMARGLFTRENPERTLGLGRHAIVARGYDKFFNIDELPSTTWEALEKRTQAPYHLTLKTNGCIIFLAALSSSELLVTSKHATAGAPAGSSDEQGPPSHSAVGERWVERHLARVGLTRAALAHELWAANATAVAELTDDDFEEHVIATPADQVGLNLHGINLNTPELLTYPPALVAQCAARWGMHPTPFAALDSLDAVKDRCRAIQADGWPGRSGHVEGVVVRASPRDQPSHPTLPTRSVFWKVKFEEPYLTYREWRELTRKILHEKAQNAQAFADARTTGEKSLDLAASAELAKALKVNVRKIHKPETRLYVHWALQELLHRPQTFELWHLNRGIVAARDAFFRWRASPEARTLALAADNLPPDSSAVDDDQPFDKTLLAPIGIPGCGKTTLAVALKTLVECGHTQSDDITTKKTGPAFIENVKAMLLAKEGPSVVIADKNNHLRTHRAALAELVEKLAEGVTVKKGRGKGAATERVRVRVRLVALTWDLESHPADELHRVAGQRIVVRGANHQSLRPELTAGGLEAHDAILWRFLKTLEPFDPALHPEDRAFRHAVPLLFAAPLDANLRTLCTHLHALCPALVSPQLAADPRRIAQALETAKAYRPAVKKEMKVEPGLLAPRYFGVQIAADLGRVVADMLGPAADDEPPAAAAGRRMYRQLVETGRLTGRPHLTLVHQNQTRECPQMLRQWEEYQSRVLARATRVALVLGPTLLWNARVMVVEAALSPPPAPASPPTTDRFHVTVGTADEAIRPVEGFDLLHRFFRGSPASSAADQVFSLHVKTVAVEGTLKGFT